MRTLILYHSKQGSTKKYAEDIGGLVMADVMPFKKFKPAMISNYDTIVFGSRVMGSKIQKVNDFLLYFDEMAAANVNVIVFAVGMSIVTKETRENLILSNILDNYHVRFYQLRGSFDYSKLSLFEKLLMSNSLRMISNDPNATADQKMLLTLKEEPLICYDQAGVDRVVAVLKKLDTIVEA